MNPKNVLLIGAAAITLAALGQVSTALADGYPARATPVAKPKPLKVQAAKAEPAKPAGVAKVEKVVAKSKPKKAEPTRVAKVEKAKPAPTKLA